MITQWHPPTTREQFHTMTSTKYTGTILLLIFLSVNYPSNSALSLSRTLAPHKALLISRKAWPKPTQDRSVCNSPAHSHKKHPTREWRAHLKVFVCTHYDQHSSHENQRRRVTSRDATESIPRQDTEVISMGGYGPHVVHWNTAHSSTDVIMVYGFRIARGQRVSRNTRALTSARYPGQTTKVLMRLATLRKNTLHSTNTILFVLAVGATIAYGVVYSLLLREYFIYITGLTSAATQLLQIWAQLYHHGFI